MPNVFLVLLLLLIPGAALPQPDLSGTIPIIDETFAGPLDRYDGRSGLWSTSGRSGRLMTNATEAVFLDHGVLGEAADALLPPLHVATEDGLSLRTAKLPEAVLPALREYMTLTGQGDRAADILYGVGRISTVQTWSQTYGYFEIEARVPRGKGRWPAFWLTFAGRGWPPEIDVMEAYGAGLDKPTNKDGTFNTAVFFDALDAEGDPTLETDIVNPHAAPEEGDQPTERQRAGRSIYNFHRVIEAETDFGADIYDDFHVYAALWTPETVIFYFGTTRDTLQEVYRTPTPPDVQAPMYVIANDQFTAGFWQARPEEIDRVVDPENDFRIRRIVVRALEPELSIDLGAGDNPDDPRASRIVDTPGDDLIAPGDGFDLIQLSGGADRLYLVRGRDQKIVSGFGPDDRIDLDGYPFADGADILSRLTQVGADVWLPSGADPVWPHTIVFRDSQVADFSADQFRPRWPVAQDVWATDATRPNQPQTDEDGDGVLTSDRDGAWYSDRDQPVRMVGTPGPDRFMVGNAETMIDEAADGGVDTLITWTSYTLPDSIERGIVRGPGFELRGTDGDDRLETEAAGATLAGGPGDDLYVIAPNASHTAIRIDAGAGHDRVRGLGLGDQLVLHPNLLATRTDWRIREQPGLLRVDFTDEQSLTLEGLSRDTFLALIKTD